MEIQLIVTIVILVILIAVGVIMAFVAVRRSKEGKPVEPNYRIFLYVGIAFLSSGTIWVIVSLSTDISIVLGITFLVLGMTYFTISLVNRNKWRK